MHFSAIFIHGDGIANGIHWVGVKKFPHLLVHELSFFVFISPSAGLDTAVCRIGVPFDIEVSDQSASVLVRRFHFVYIHNGAELMKTQ